jgi:hypothetical protein
MDIYNIIPSVYVADAPNERTTADNVSVIATDEPQNPIRDTASLVLHYNDPREAPDYMQKCMIITT